MKTLTPLQEYKIEHFLRQNLPRMDLDVRRVFTDRECASGSIDDLCFNFITSRTERPRIAFKKTTDIFHEEDFYEVSDTFEARFYLVLDDYDAEMLDRSSYDVIDTILKEMKP